MGSLKNGRVVVVGGSSGIGLATAAHLHAAGARVVIASRSLAKLEKAEQAIGKPIEKHALDVTSEPEVADFFERIGAFDHLVITSAGVAVAPFLELKIDAAKEFFESKFWGAYRLAYYGARRISKEGSITFISGAASHRAAPTLAAGSAINAALEALGRTLAVELAPIRVNTIAPGLIETPVWNDFMTEEAKQGFFADASAKLPLKRIGKGEDIARAVQHMIENTYTTGSVLVVDGGYLQV